MGLNLGEAFGTDKDLEEEGKWFDIGGEARIRVARFGNKKHKKTLDKLRAPYKPVLLRGGDIPEDANDEIIKRSLSEAVLVDWEGLIDEKGNPIPYTPDAAYQAFCQYSDFLDLVSRLALDANQYRVLIQEQTVKK